MNLTKFIFFPLALLALVACTSFTRSSESGYSSPSANGTLSNWKKVSKSEDFHRHEEAPISDTKLRLKQLENRISGKRELEQYSRSLPWFNDDQEKIHFLDIEGYEPRQEWLNAQDFGTRAKKVAAQMQEIIEAQDIALGMPENLVKRSWGEPSEIEVSGSPQFHNQRWKYQKFVSTQEGYKSERKTVYFEAGRVVGWETE